MAEIAEVRQSFWIATRQIVLEEQHEREEGAGTVVETVISCRDVEGLRLEQQRQMSIRLQVQLRRYCLIF